ncbi:hypothetical protein M427DRAFT_51496 [Gonapodya prolifera JEL478]|uniref:Uncharacterized protein n=1 Tax=Gonapodya prolifera (strain JEL478) TaxID=1344416 RepID=A0A139AWX8_GONPJ|nr:hypothetical protein M427DRAFT_51496 [Gonapodya prolifera JEL478]|eukprot:KXS21246.1 hypothetical protein M427DRAFT_51496 [Gonapodya prolifera JEL478]
MSTNAPLPSLPTLYRRILREVRRQYTSVNNDHTFRTAIIDQIRASGGALTTFYPLPTNPAIAEHRTLADLATYLEQTRIHRHMMETYWPADRMSDAERIEASAQRVGLRLPRMFQNMLEEEEEDGVVKSFESSTEEIEGEEEEKDTSAAKGFEIGVGGKSTQ